MLTLEYNENMHDRFSKDMREVLTKTSIDVNVAIQSRILPIEIFTL